MTRKAFQISNGYAPEGGPKCLPFTVDFTARTTYQFDTYLEETSGEIKLIQGIYVDNANNPQQIVFVFHGTNQRLIVPALSQGMYPVLTATEMKCDVTTTGGVPVSWQLMNVPVAYTQWGPTTVNIANNAQTFSYVTPVITGRNQTLMGATVADQTILAANLNRRRLLLFNRVSNVDIVTIGFGVSSVSNPSIDLMPGGVYDTGAGPIDQSAIHFSSPTAGTMLAATEFTS